MPMMTIIQRMSYYILYDIIYGIVLVAGKGMGHVGDANCAHWRSLCDVNLPNSVRWRSTICNGDAMQKDFFEI